ncbi:hypothetical protein OBA40_03410 [Alphaproteobacteria bacterium]|nr:hypothetical protein [Alphaproteobacteria bacterium]
MKSYYSSDRISMSLRTKSNGLAIRASKSICQRLDDYWLGLRLQKMDIPAIHFVSSNEDSDDSSTNITDALDLYLRPKGKSKDKIFIRTATCEIFGVKPTIILSCHKLINIRFKEFKDE